MLDRLKVIKGLEEAVKVIENYVPERYRGYSRLSCYDAIALLREQEPRLLELEEVKAIALREAERILSTEVEPVWLEQNEGGLTRLVLVLISWWYMEGIDKDETEFEFIVKYFGTDLDDTLNYLDYGTRWRVWSSKPTIEQRKAVEWDAAD